MTTKKRLSIQMKFPWVPPLKGDVCVNCGDVMDAFCNVCNRCPMCGHVRECEGDFVEVDDKW